MLGNHSHLLPNMNLTAQQVALHGIMNESAGSNRIDLLQNKLQVSDYLNAYRASTQRSTSNPVLGNGIAAPTPAELAMVAEIERLREQNNAQLMSLIRSGLLSSSSPLVNGSIDATSNQRANSHIIADFLSRVNHSSATATPPPLLTNVAMACLNRNSGRHNLSPSDSRASAVSRFSKSS